MSLNISDQGLLRTQAYINGHWSDSDDGSTFDVTNPATGVAIASCASCGTDETRRAIEAAEIAQVAWRNTTGKERAALLRKWFNLMMESQEDLAIILTAEQGKPLAVSMIARSALFTLSFRSLQIVSLNISDQGLLRTQAYINGHWSDSDDGSTFDVTNPATGVAIASCASCGTDETRRAIEAAEIAQVAWRNTTGKERAALLRKWFNLMMESQEDLAIILTAEQGKPLAESRGEIAYGAFRRYRRR